MRERRVERNTRIIVSLIFAPFLLFALNRFVGELLPFQPYTIHSFILERNSGCPGERVLVSVDRSISRPALGRAEDVTILSAWTNGREPSRLRRPGFSVFAGEYGRETVPGTSPRSTPLAPGVYRLVADVVVRGRVLGQDRAQAFTVTNGPRYRVLRPGEGGCRS